MSETIEYLEPGTKFCMLAEIVRKVYHNEPWPSAHGVPTPIGNHRGDKWIIRQNGGPETLMIISDPESFWRSVEAAHVLQNTFEIDNPFTGDKKEKLERAANEARKRVSNYTREQKEELVSLCTKMFNEALLKHTNELP